MKIMSNLEFKLLLDNVKVGDILLIPQDTPVEHIPNPYEAIVIDKTEDTFSTRLNYPDKDQQILEWSYFYNFAGAVIKT